MRLYNINLIAILNIFIINKIIKFVKKKMFNTFLSVARIVYNLIKLYGPIVGFSSLTYLLYWKLEFRDTEAAGGHRRARNVRGPI